LGLFPEVGFGYCAALARHGKSGGAQAASTHGFDDSTAAMDLNFLDFEQPIAELEAKIEELRLVGHDNEINIGEEIERLEKKSRALTESVFAGLSPWQISQLSRHPQRPYLLDYVRRLFDEFHELHGDRAFADDPAIVGGLARIEGRAVMVIGHQKGRDTKEKIYRNFGMPRPEGYRKALRLMSMAERFRLPVLTFIDTPGAYPGVGAEERGQSEAIARNLQVMSRLRTPILCTVVGEGGSGGALAIGVGDRLLMLQYSTYSVISPEGCASILWKSADKAQLAAEAMSITSDKLKEHGLVDLVIPEPLGGAHRDLEAVSLSLRRVLVEQLDALQTVDLEVLIAERYTRLMGYGKFKE
jgi:acetyl-CoA carboxylase carboxyl transferase subunit alpha